MATVGNSRLRPLSVRPEGGLAQIVDRWIYVFMAVLFVVTALAGFVPDSLDRIAAVQAGQRPPFPPVLHVHAVLMGAWLILLLAQSLLMATGRRSFHRQLGLAAFVLAPAIVVVGLVLVPTMRAQAWDLAQATAAGPQRAVMVAGFARAMNTMLVQLRMGFVFSVSIVWALRARLSDPSLHKRLLFLGTVVLLVAGIDRITVLPTTRPQSFIASDLYTLLWISPMFAWDLYRLGRVHKAYLIWLGIAAPPTAALYALWGTGWWQATAPHLIGLEPLVR